MSLTWIIVLTILVISAYAYYVSQQQDNNSGGETNGAPAATMPKVGGTTPKGVQYIYAPYAVCTLDASKTAITATANPGADLDAMMAQGATNGIFQVNSDGIPIAPIIGGKWVSCIIVSNETSDAVAITNSAPAFILATQSFVSPNGVKYRKYPNLACAEWNPMPQTGNPIDNMPSGSVAVGFDDNKAAIACTSVLTTYSPASFVYAATSQAPITTTSSKNAFKIPTYGCAVSDPTGTFRTTNYADSLDACRAGIADGEYSWQSCLGIVPTGVNNTFNPCYQYGGVGATPVNGEYQLVSPAATVPLITPVGKTVFKFMPNTGCDSDNSYAERLPATTYSFTDAIDACATMHVNESGQPCVGIVPVMAQDTPARVSTANSWVPCTATAPLSGAITFLTFT